MNWEELDIYRPLTKEKLKPAFKDFTKLIATGLSTAGFVLKGRKLVRNVNDLLHVIHIDTRGSWTGTNEHFKTQIAIIHIADLSPFIRNFELTGVKRIEDIVPKIRNYYRITQEYPLLADFIIRKIFSDIEPYLNNWIAHNKS